MSVEADHAAPWVANAPRTGRWQPLRLHDVWRHRELIFFFAARDVKVRYKQALLGVGWAVIQPLLGALMFTVLFNRLADVDVGETSYFAFALVGYSAWSYFSASLTAGAASLLANAELLTKVAFPRIVAPIAAMLPAAIDLAVGLALSAGIATASGDTSLSDVALVVPGLALLAVAATGPVLALSALVVRFRDVNVLVSFGIQLFLFATPVAYPPELVPDGWRTMLYLNPVAGSLGLLRAALVDTDPPAAVHVATSIASGLVLVIVGLVSFRRREAEFADII